MSRTWSREGETGRVKSVAKDFLNLRITDDGPSTLPAIYVRSDGLRCTVRFTRETPYYVVDIECGSRCARVEPVFTSVDISRAIAYCVQGAEVSCGS